MKFEGGLIAAMQIPLNIHVNPTKNSKWGKFKAFVCFE